MAALSRTCTNLIRRGVGRQRKTILNRRHFNRDVGSCCMVNTTPCSFVFAQNKLNVGISRCPHLTFVANLHTSDHRRKRDYYEVLGVPKNADAATIKKAYYKLAKKYHPDMNKNDPDGQTKFQEVSEAYEVLSDVEKKRDYDSFGMSGSGTGQGAEWARQAGNMGGFEHFHGSIDPEELFRKIFGSAGFGMSGFGNMNDFEESKFGFAPASEIMMDLSFQEAARGVNKEININVKDTCPKCLGKKAEPGTKPITCPQCNGTGMETISTGPFVMRTTCRRCYGQRVVIKTPCTECNGKGNMILRKKVVVPVPAGVEDGQTVRMPVGKQEVFITFKVAKSRIFRREGADVHSDVAISLSQAVLGGTIRVPGIYDDILLNITPGTHSHERIRQPGKGINRVNSYGYGDHYIHIKIKVPTKLTSEQKALILAYAELEKNTEGTINGVAHTKSAGKKDGESKLNTEDKNDDDDDDDESLLGKLKRRLFG
ncbi:protein tumorous imaginal discs, mitochondrial-like isoform X2 [Gigantopelta aegis]|uniref:protein tumorous imaginal discs, mitochondrial-like isoform X2 n=1 Tax=Gigantopelta aegis TaxID=1735272 RepID=UPI001B88D712|nr:protein tumorous imaginal discs, mitochondrial-like isoform X2 [Gigantopelta aegis]